MPLRKFRISGQVIDSRNRKGVPDLRVEAWDRDDPRHIVFGASITDERGEYLISATVDLPEVVTVPIPAVLNVFRGTERLPVAGEKTIANLLTFDGRAILALQRSDGEPALHDKVTVPQILNAIDFIRLSDFKGLLQEGRDRQAAAFDLAFDTVKNAISGMELKPIKPPEIRNKDIVHQDISTARGRLEAQGITINEVKPYRKDLASLGTIRSLPVNLKRGEKIDVYEENGVIKAYAVVRPERSSIDRATVTKLNDDMQSLRRDLDHRSEDMNRLDQDAKSLRTDASSRAAQIEELRVKLAQREATITELSSKLVDVKKAHDVLAEQVKPERLTALEDSIRRIQDRLPR